jgi:hypothetical protein
VRLVLAEPTSIWPFCRYYSALLSEILKCWLGLNLEKAVEITKYTKPTKNQGFAKILSFTQRGTSDRVQNKLDHFDFGCFVCFVVHLNCRF